MREFATYLVGGVSVREGSMKLDFLTLYIVIFLNSFAVAVIWAAVAYTYRSFVAARIWLLGCVLTMLGGVVLVFHGSDGSILAAVIGNGIVIFGFCQFWVGIRRFYGAGGGMFASAIITLVSMVFLVIAFDSLNARNMVYATAQSVPMALGIAYLLHPGRRQLGAWIAAIAMAIGILGHAIETGSNLAMLADAISRATYLRIEVTAVLIVVFSAVLWNFGFAVMTIDRLRNEVAALAVEDELTGLPNRRRLLERIAHEEARSARTNRPYAILMIDLDYFKELNDAFGHAGGDAALRHFAVTAAAQVRKNDLVARLGGDEFCVILPETDAPHAAALAAGIAESVRLSPFRLQGMSIAMTVSIGVAAWQANNEEGDTLARADRALYNVKASGRNGFRLDGVPANRGVKPSLAVVASRA